MKLTAVPLRAAALLFALTAGVGAAAQPATAPSVERVYARPGYPTITVYVMGSVTSPGLWRVEDGVPLMDLLAVSGPETPAPAEGGTREYINVKLYRPQGASSRTLSIDSELEPLLLGPQATTPLRQGDLVQVSLVVVERGGWSFLEILEVVGTLASLAALGFTIAR